MVDISHCSTLNNESPRLLAKCWARALRLLADTPQYPRLPHRRSAEMYFEFLKKKYDEKIEMVWTVLMYMKKGYEVESQDTNEAKKKIFIHKKTSLNKNKNKQFDKQIEIKTL